MVLGEELTVAQGVLKVNSKILEGHELKKLDKLEKSLVNGLHITGKGENRVQKCIPTFEGCFGSSSKS